MPPAALPLTAQSSDAVARFRNQLSADLLAHVGRSPDSATVGEWRMALTRTIRGLVTAAAIETEAKTATSGAKEVNYLSMEFLIGRVLEDAVLNLGLQDVAAQACHELGLEYRELVLDEPDAALGNGGLGRLAACFLESMATVGVSGYGYGIRYNHGLFRQSFEDGFQCEAPEDWLRRGEAWSISRQQPRRLVGFGGTVTTEGDRQVWTPEDTVLAVAHDWLVPGWGGKFVNTLRLWAAEPVAEIDFDAFNRADFTAAAAPTVAAQTISRVLYPDDTTNEGKALRLKQEYFFTAASLADIVDRHLARGRRLEDLPQFEAVQMNDTHPAIAPAELIRILHDEHGLSFREAAAISQQCLSYTNHTLMPEALETWPVGVLSEVLPRHFEIIEEIDVAYETHFAPRPVPQIVRDDAVHMGDLAFIGSSKVNGVSALHSDLMKQTVFGELHTLHPERIVNQTNGVTPRRWLWNCNPGLRDLINDTIGSGWVSDLDRLEALAPYADDPEFRRRFAAVKLANKEAVAAWLAREHGISVAPEAMFDVHIKRLHEYKRQFMNILETAALWNEMRRAPDRDWTARIKIFGGKAAPGYVMAKSIIKLINDVAAKVNADPATCDLLRIVYPANYNVSMAERLIPASDLSEQISTAGKEASGTGNMKFALNGALTVGTLDGANVEIKDCVGDDNIFIFGQTADEVQALREHGYDPAAYIAADDRLAEVVDQIASGFFSGGDKKLYAPLVENLTKHDYFQVAADFSSYYEIQRVIDAAWKDPETWTRKAVLNTANMGYFSSDRTIRGYAKDIWGVKPAIS